MAKVSNLKLDIDLEEMFGAPVTDSNLREAIAGAVIDRIRERTQEQNVDKNGRPFAKYSDAYKKSAAFKIFGKSGNNVDLTMTGDMLSALTVTKQNDSTITLGFPDSTQNAKAFNHTTGDTVPRRDFFGIQKQELAKIASEFEDRVSRSKKGFDTNQLFGDRTREIISRLLSDDEEG